MANSSVLPPQPASRPAGPAKSGSVPAHASATDVIAATPSVTQSGPRKLVRPTLPESPLRRNFSRRSEPALMAHQALADHALAAAGHDSSHAEAFYFQKQVQAQTLMCFVLSDGEKVEGVIEWYDRNSLKIRNGTRTLIYKSCIKYLYKVGDNTH